MKLVIWIESVLIVLMSLFGWAFVANHDISPKVPTSTHETPVNAICDGTTLMWSDFDPATGYGGNHIQVDSQSCGGSQ